MSSTQRLAIVMTLAACHHGALPPDSPADASVGSRAAGCPSTMPTQGAACSQHGLLCEYGDDYDPLCNTIAVCDDTWSSPIYFAGGSGRSCPTPPRSTTNPTECPATRASVPVAQACSTQSQCSYDGSVCSCGSVCPQSPDVSEMACDVDAGITQDCCEPTPVQWNCIDGPASCTTPRPRVGTPCDASAPSCAIDAPSVCGQIILSCQDGIWNLENTACAQ